jgi:hypothetical protein
MVVRFPALVQSFTNESLRFSSGALCHRADHCQRFINALGDKSF